MSSCFSVPILVFFTLASSHLSECILSLLDGLGYLNRFTGNQLELHLWMTQNMEIQYKRQNQWHFVVLVHVLDLAFIFIMMMCKKEKK